MLELRSHQTSFHKEQTSFQKEQGGFQKDRSIAGTPCTFTLNSFQCRRLCTPLLIPDHWTTKDMCSWCACVPAYEELCALRAQLNESRKELVPNPSKSSEVEGERALVDGGNEVVMSRRMLRRCKSR